METLDYFSNAEKMTKGSSSQNEKENKFKRYLEVRINKTYTGA